MTTLLAEYYSSGRNSIQSIWAVYPAESGNSAFGQCFKPSLSYKITSAQFDLRLHGSPTGTLKARLYLMEANDYGDGGKPSTDEYPTITTPLAESDSVDINDLTTSWQWIEFTFSGDEQYEMDTDIAYCILVNVESGSSVVVDQDYIDTGGSTGDGLLGNACKYYTPGKWGGYAVASQRDRNYKVYGDPPILDVDVEMNMFPDNVTNSVTAAAIESWLDGLSIATIRKININWQGGFYKVIVTYE